MTAIPQETWDGLPQHSHGPVCSEGRVRPAKATPGCPGGCPGLSWATGSSVLQASAAQQRGHGGSWVTPRGAAGLYSPAPEEGSG